MAEVVLFHSALGLRPAIHAWAEVLRGDGHTVHTPDLYDGEVYDSIAAGINKRDAIGIPGFTERARQAVASLPNRLYYAGFSLGAGPAELLCLTRPGAQGAVLMHGVKAPTAFGVPRWPDIPVQVHSSESDPWIDFDELEAFERAAPQAEMFTYPGSAHLFADHDFEEYDEAATRLMMERVRQFIGNG